MGPFPDNVPGQTVYGQLLRRVNIVPDVLFVETPAYVEFVSHYGFLTTSMRSLRTSFSVKPTSTKIYNHINNFLDHRNNNKY